MAVQDKKKAGGFAGIKKSFRDMVGEMKRVVWPSRKQAFNNTGVVLVFMVVMAVLIYVFDTGLGWILTTAFGGSL